MSAICCCFVVVVAVVVVVVVLLKGELYEAAIYDRVNLGDSRVCLVPH